MRRRAVLLVATMVAGLVMVGGVALAAEISCSRILCVGTQEDDDISGGGKSQYIYGQGGSDNVDAFGGKDNVRGGPGDDDSLQGAEDSDKVYGEDGNDTIDLNSNDNPSAFPDEEPVDRGFGGNGDDAIFAQDGNVDIVDCGAGQFDTVSFDAELDQINNNCEIQNSGSAGLAAQEEDMTKQQSASGEERREKK